MSYAIAIDGPAGAGKSTVAKKLAKQLNFIYIDTGAMYRAMGLSFLRQGIGPKEEERIGEALNTAEVSIGYEGGVQQVYLNGENVTDLIRTEEAGNMASASSVYPKVREKLVELQRQLAKTADVVMDGRDIGTVVLPDAQVKIYLTASVEIRARRRYLELKEKGLSCDMAEIEKDIKDRDFRDMNREVSPLRQAEDAIVVDASDMTVDEVVDSIMTLVRQKNGEN